IQNLTRQATRQQRQRRHRIGGRAEHRTHTPPRQSLKTIHRRGISQHRGRRTGCPRGVPHVLEPRRSKRRSSSPVLVRDLHEHRGQRVRQTARLHPSQARPHLPQVSHRPRRQRRLSPPERLRRGSHLL